MDEINSIFDKADDVVQHIINELKWFEREFLNHQRDRESINQDKKSVIFSQHISFYKNMLIHSERNNAARKCYITSQLYHLIGLLPFLYTPLK